MRTSEQIKAEIEQCFGFFPPFLGPAQQHPQVLENLWQQTLFAYVNNPLSTLFKEKLCAYLSHYCAIPYCLACHICSLRTLGMTDQQVMRLLELPAPEAEDIEDQLCLLAAQPAPLTLPELNSNLEQSLLSCAIFIFLDRGDTQVHAKLRHLLDIEHYQHLIALLSYLKTYFLWMEAHPEVDYRADKRVQAHFTPEEAGLADFLQHYHQRQQECHQVGIVNLNHQRSLRGHIPADEQAACTEAEAANCIKDKFLADLAHELRSRLHPILGWSKLLQSRKFDEAKTTYALQAIERNALLQSELVENLLDCPTPQRASESNLHRSSEEESICHRLAPGTCSPSPSLPRILLVEDNTDMRDYLRLLLQERFEVEALADGAAALASVRYQVPDLVLSDVMMPGLDGFELLRELRADSQTRDVPFILLSALTDVESTIEGLEAGADDYLGKPFSTRELFARVGANLELARMRREVHYERAARVEAEQARKELEKLNQLKDDFLSTVSHELRTPMTNIKMAIQMLQVVDTAELRYRYVQILQLECTREIDLINNLLDLQRLESGTPDVEWSQFQLQEWLVPIVEPFIERAKSHDQTLWLDLSPKLPHLLSDPVSLERIIAELLNNACKYTPKGGEITLTARPKLGSDLGSKSSGLCGVELIVSNSGCEIPDSELVRIFEKFYRVQNSDPWKQGGTGLGLALVQKLVALLGGKISAESLPNKVIFTVELPGNNS